MRKKFKKLVGITTAVAMAVSLVPTNVFAEEPEVVVAEESAKNDNLLRVWYDEPATDWQTQSLAIGNGYMGSLVFGGINKDKIHINEKTVWEGGPTSYNGYSYGTTNRTETDADLQKIKDDLNAIREKLDDKSEYVFGFNEDSYEASGTNTKGEAMDWLNKLMGDLVGYSAPKDYANLYISNNQDSSKVSNYVRDLDMRTALATVNYDYEGVHYTREYFDSYPDNVMAVRLSADQKGKISFDTNLQSLIGGRTHKSTVDGDTITMRDALGGNGLNIEAQLKVINEGGNLSSNANGSNPSITVSDADAVTLIFACGTDYKMELPNFRGEDPHDAVTARINAAAKKGYEALKEDHVADHSALFSRMELGFNEEVPTIPTDELIKKYRNMVDNNGGEVPTESEQRALEVICYQFGRYLTIAGSREGALPTNLQGVWGEGYFQWGGDYHFNINVQMNYWPTLASNLAECQIAYNDYLNVLKEAGRYAAAAAFGIKSDEGEENGWLVGCFSTPYMFSALGQKNNAAGWNPIGSAWALLNAYEYYLYTEDTDYLKNELYPSLKEVANFWNEALYWSEYQQRYVSAPSYSPENGPIVNGASYDQQFIWQHFENTIQAAETLGVDADLVAEWKEKQSKLDPVLVGDDGQVKEWYEETHFGKAQAGDLGEIDIPQWRQSLGAQSGGVQPPHRHLSHLMALYPCNMISKDNPEFMDAAIVSLNERGLDATGWSKAHKLNLWARTGHSDEAFQIVQSAVGGGNSGFLTNLLSSHGGGANYKGYPIFQIDGNFGYTAGVNEMLLQSQLGYVQFLPAVPEQWNTGHVEGIVARGNFEIDMNWSEGKADRFEITSRNGNTFTGEYDNIAAYAVKKSDGTKVETTAITDNKISFPTEVGETYTIDFNSTPEKLQGVIDQAKELLDKMGGKVLDVQKAHLVELIQAAEKVVEEEKSDEYYDNTQILLKAIKVGEAAIELRDSCSEAEEVYEGRDVNEDWASYVNTAANLDNQLDAAVELLKDTECTVTELNLMKKSVDEAKDALLGIWDKLIVTIKPTDKEMLGAEDKVTISSEFDDLQIRYTIDGNEPTWFSEEYTEPFAMTRSKETVKAALFLGRRQMSEVSSVEYISKEALNVEDSIEKTYTSVTDNGTSGDSEGLAGALDGKHNGTAWQLQNIPAELELQFAEPVEVNAAEVALDNYYPDYIDIKDMDIEYWDGNEWVAAVKGASIGGQSRVFLFDSFKSDKVKLRINKAWLYDYYHSFGWYTSIDAFRLFNLNDVITTDKSSLDMVISVAQKNIDDGEVDAAIESVRESFTAVFNYAKDVSANVQSSQAVIDNTTIALIEEIQKLGFKAGDKTQLQSHYNLYSALNLDLYIDGEEKDAFVEALENAKAVIEDGDAMEADVVAADQKLVDAAEALVKKGDKTSLQKLVDSTADYKKENYLSAGWNTFEVALDAAKKVLADESATQEDVDKAKEVLTSAMTALRYKADKSVLEEIIGKAKAMDLTGYSAENVALFNAALAKAEAVMANEELSVYEQPIVDAAVLDLQNAMKALNDEKDNASKPSDPSKPSNPSKPGSGNGNGATGSDKNNGSGSDGKHQATTAGKQNGGNTVSGTNGKATKTGDVTPIIPAAAGVILSMAAIVVVLKKRKR